MTITRKGFLRDKWKIKRKSNCVKYKQEVIAQVSGG